MAKIKNSFINKGSLADNWLKGFNQFMGELSMGDTGPEAENKRRIKRRGMHPEAQLEEQKKQDEASATPGQDPDKPNEFERDGSSPTGPKKSSSLRGISDIVRRPQAKEEGPREERPFSGPQKDAENKRLHDNIVVAGQKVDNSGASGNTSGQESGSEKSALEQQVASLTAQVEKLLQAQTAPQQSTGDQFLQSATPTGAGTTKPEGLHTTRVGSSGTNIYSGEQGIPDEAPAQQAPPPENVPLSRAGMAGGRRGISQAVQAGNQQDAASGGGSRGLMAAIGDAVGGAANAISGGPRAPLKAQYKNMGQTELARLQRQGIEIYETETDAFAKSFKGG